MSSHLSLLKIKCVYTLHSFPCTYNLWQVSKKMLQATLSVNMNSSINPRNYFLKKNMWFTGLLFINIYIISMCKDGIKCKNSWCAAFHEAPQTVISQSVFSSTWQSTCCDITDWGVDTGVTCCEAWAHREQWQLDTHLCLQPVQNLDSGLIIII